MAPRKSKKPQDPHAEREKMRYGDPVASRELIMQSLKEQGKPETCETLQKLLGINTAKQIEAFERRLKAMERDGQLISNRKNEYCLISKTDLISGRVSGHR